MPFRCITGDLTPTPSLGYPMRRIGALKPAHSAVGVPDYTRRDLGHSISWDVPAGTDEGLIRLYLADTERRLAERTGLPVRHVRLDATRGFFKARVGYRE